MATSSSHLETQTLDLQSPKCEKLCDEVYQLHVPENGAISLDIVLFHGFQPTDDGDAYLRCWRREEDPTCSLNRLLAESFPQARILAVAYDASIHRSEKKGRMDMYAIGESLTRSLVSLAMVGQTCPVVLVGHCVGGLVLKKVCLRADNFGGRKEDPDRHGYPFLRFMGNLKGAFFYATAHSGSPISRKGKSKRTSPLFAYLEQLCVEAGRINASFATLCGRHGWKTAGVCEADETDTRNWTLTRFRRFLPWTQTSDLVTPEASARHGVRDGNFCVIAGEDHFSICRPKDRKSTNFLRLEEFLRTICKEEVEHIANQQRFLQLPVVMIDFPERVNGVVQRLELESIEDTRLALQLVGMGGIGKSTLAKQVLKKIQYLFDYVWFVEVGKHTLSSQILDRLVGDDFYTGRGRRIPVRNVDEFWTLVQNSKVLLVLDDVESEKQIELFLEPSHFGDGSRLIVTSRIQKAMLGFVTYLVPLLAYEDAEKLFTAHVDPPVLNQIPEKLVKEVVSNCAGLPLTLEVIGSHLRGENDISIWEGALEKLCAAESIGGSVDDILWKKLRLSFDGLGSAEQGRFLDLTSFDIDGAWREEYDLDVFKAAWRSLSPGMAVEIELQNLVYRSLIHVSKYYGGACGQEGQLSGKVYIHAQLRAMGQNISRPPSKNLKLCRGLWKQEDTEDLVKECKRGRATTNSALQVLSMRICQRGVVEGEPLSIPWNIFPNLESLRLLRMSNLDTIESDDSVRFPLSLTLLHMINCREELRMRSSGKWPIREQDVEGLSRLAVLLLDKCNFVQLPDNIQELKNLRILQLDASNMASLPDNFGLLQKLETLHLHSASLQSLPSSFLRLGSLRSLDMSGCSGLKAWPSPDAYSIARKDFCRLESLRVLELSGLHSLAELPESFGGMRNLEELLIKDCTLLKALPEGFSGLKRLNRLRIRSCKVLQSLCESFGYLENLESLELCTLPALARLPSSMGSLQSLTSLTLEFIPQLMELPESIGEIQPSVISGINESLWDISRRHLSSRCGLSNLEVLSISDCRSLSSLPESLGQLRALKIFYLAGCSSLKCLPDSMGGLGALEQLYMHGCSSLKCLPESIGGLGALETLYMHRCSSLKCLPESIGELGNLSELQTRRSIEFSAESVRQLTALEDLDLYPPARANSDMFPGPILNYFKALKRLRIHQCAIIDDCLGQLRRLTELEIYGGEIKCLPESLGSLTSLTTLVVKNCKRFDRLPLSVGQLTALETLQIINCGIFHLVPGSLRHLTSLKDLVAPDIRGFAEFQEALSCFTELDALTVMHSGGDIVKGLSEILKTFHHLDFLTIHNSENFEGLLESVGELKNLSVLRIEESKALQGSFDLRCLGRFESLELLCFRGCVYLESFLPLQFRDWKDFWSPIQGYTINVQNCPKFIGFRHSSQAGRSSYDDRNQVHEWPCRVEPAEDGFEPVTF